MIDRTQNRAMFFLQIILVAAILIPTSSSSSTSLKKFIENGRVESIGIGDQAERIVSIFGSQYLIEDVKAPKSAREIRLLHKGNLVVKFTLNDRGRIFLIDVYSSYGTKEGIGVGSTLSDAEKAYGKSRIAPTDVGYWVTFENLKGIGFLLDDRDIPRELRRIPDDVITKEQEAQILRIGTATIIAIQIF
jgi:hypothetical protein